MKRLLLVAVVAALTLLAGAGTAWAYWTASGSQSATGTGDTLPQGATPSGTVAYSGGSSTVTLTFTTRTTATRGAAITNYVVKRYATPTGGAAANTFTCSLPGSCTESGVGNGTWYYTDTPQLGNWTGAESTRSAGVLVNTTRHFAVAAGTSQTAGTAFGITLTVQNSDGTTDTGYTGSHQITWTTTAHNSPSGTSPTLPANGQYTFSAGVLTITAGATLVDAESGVTIGASDDSSISGSSAGITVNAASASKFTVSPTTTTPTAGAQFGVTITAFDAYGNLVASYTGSHQITWTTTAHNSPSGTSPTLPANGQYTFTSGSVTIPSTSGATLVDAESGVTITATEGAIGGTSAPISVSPAAAATFCITTTLPTCNGASLSIKKGTTWTSTVTLEDRYGNIAPSTAVLTPSVSVSGNGSVTPSSLTINAGSSVTTGGFTYTAASGTNKSGTVTIHLTGFTDASVTFTST